MNLVNCDMLPTFCSSAKWGPNHGRGNGESETTHRAAGCTCFSTSKSKQQLHIF